MNDDKSDDDDTERVRSWPDWRDLIGAPDPAFGKPSSSLPMSHPYWPYQGHPDNTDRYYDDHVAMFGPIPGYQPSVERGYIRQPAYKKAGVGPAGNGADKWHGRISREDAARRRSPHRYRNEHDPG